MEIRSFCNADLPSLTRVWSEHWTAAESPPRVSAAIIERAVLSRSFFSPHELLVLVVDDRIEAWCHFSCPGRDGDEWSAQESNDVAILSSICFSQAGLHHSDALLDAVIRRVADAGCHQILAGPLRDQQCGYVGLPPVGHGIGIPDIDIRVSSLLSRHGFSPAESAVRMVVTTAP